MKKLNITLAELNSKIGYSGVVFCMKNYEVHSKPSENDLLIVAQRTSVSTSVTLVAYKVFSATKISCNNYSLSLCEVENISYKKNVIAQKAAIAKIAHKFEFFTGEEQSVSLKKDKKSPTNETALFYPMDQYVNSNENIIIYDGSTYIPVQSYNHVGRMDPLSLDFIELKPGMVFISTPKSVLLDKRHLSFRAITQVNPVTNEYCYKEIPYNIFTEVQLMKMRTCLHNQKQFFNITTHTIKVASADAA